jgi:hypothetical protein
MTVTDSKSKFTFPSLQLINPGKAPWAMRVASGYKPLLTFEQMLKGVLGGFEVYLVPSKSYNRVAGAKLAAAVKLKSALDGDFTAILGHCLLPEEQQLINEQFTLYCSAELPAPKLPQMQAWPPAPPCPADNLAAALELLRQSGINLPAAPAPEKKAPKAKATPKKKRGELSESALSKVEKLRKEANALNGATPFDGGE